jgi:hypothetical protein
MRPAGVSNEPTPDRELIQKIRLRLLCRKDLGGGDSFTAMMWHVLWGHHDSEDK